ncbi:MAG: S8 family peptidase [Nitrospirota bacterium]
MKKNICGVLAGIVLLHCSVSAFAFDAYVPGELLVKTSPAAGVYAINSVLQKIGGRILHAYGIVEGLYCVRVNDDASLSDTISVLESDPTVEYAEPNYMRSAFLIPDDPGIPYLWGLLNTGQTGGAFDADIDAGEAWDITTGHQDTVIAVIDTGVDMEHDDLSANIWSNAGEIPGNGVDDDGNGYVDDVHGWDFYANDNDPSDTPLCRHGTHVSGTIGAVGNNGLGVVGINWTTKIMPLRFLGGPLCSGTDANAIRAIEYAAGKQVRIANNSWGGGGYSRAVEEAIRNSAMIFVAAAGNGGWDGAGDNNDLAPHYPSSYPLDNILAVAATDHNDALAPFSNYGNASVDLTAPGVTIASTIPDNKYAYFSGTSMATPHVTGVVGLLVSQNPAAENWEIIYKILQGADRKGLPVLTGGRLNAYNALSLPDGSKVRSEENTGTYVGTWSDLANSGFSSGTVKYSNQKYAYVTFTFSGSGIRWVASKAGMLGKADVYLDGSYTTTIDLYNPGILHQQVVYSNLSLSNGLHTLGVVVKGEKNPGAANTFVNLDAIEIIH